MSTHTSNVCTLIIVLTLFQGDCLAHTGDTIVSIDKTRILADMTYVNANSLAAAYVQGNGANTHVIIDKYSLPKGKLESSRIINIGVDIKHINMIANESSTYMHVSIFINDVNNNIVVYRIDTGRFEEAKIYDTRNSAIKADGYIILKRKQVMGKNEYDLAIGAISTIENNMRSFPDTRIDMSIYGKETSNHYLWRFQINNEDYHQAFIGVTSDLKYVITRHRRSAITIYDTDTKTSLTYDAGSQLDKNDAAKVTIYDMTVIGDRCMCLLSDNTIRTVFIENGVTKIVNTPLQLDSSMRAKKIARSRPCCNYMVISDEVNNYIYDCRTSRVLTQKFKRSEYTQLTLSETMDSIAMYDGNSIIVKYLATK